MLLHQLRALLQPCGHRHPPPYGRHDATIDRSSSSAGQLCRGTGQSQVWRAGQRCGGFGLPILILPSVSQPYRPRSPRRHLLLINILMQPCWCWCCCPCRRGNGTAWRAGRGGQSLEKRSSGPLELRRGHDGGSHRKRISSSSKDPTVLVCQSQPRPRVSPHKELGSVGSIGAGDWQVAWYLPALLSPLFRPCAVRLASSGSRLRPGQGRGAEAPSNRQQHSSAVLLVGVGGRAAWLDGWAARINPGASAEGQLQL
eukprot:COSAG01_NODE_36_length_34092_cov_26.350032_28_plen_256_part_00